MSSLGDPVCMPPIFLDVLEPSLLGAFSDLPSCCGLSVPSLGAWLLLPAVLSLVAWVCSCPSNKSLGHFICSTFNEHVLRAYCVPGPGLGPGLCWDSAVHKTD